MCPLDADNGASDVSNCHHLFTEDSHRSSSKPCESESIGYPIEYDNSHLPTAVSLHFTNQHLPSTLPQYISAEQPQQFQPLVSPLGLERHEPRKLLGAGMAAASDIDTVWNQPPSWTAYCQPETQLVSNDYPQQPVSKHLVNLVSPYLQPPLPGDLYAGETQPTRHYDYYESSVSSASSSISSSETRRSRGNSFSNHSPRARGRRKSHRASFSSMSSSSRAFPPGRRFIDEQGIPYLIFEYPDAHSQKQDFTVRCDIENAESPSTYPEDFILENCLYPRANVPPEKYLGHRLVYETECNEIGWRLVRMNPFLAGQRGLTQRAVDTYRNTSNAATRSRRARRLARQQEKEQQEREQREKALRERELREKELYRRSYLDDGNLPDPSFTTQK